MLELSISLLILICSALAIYCIQTLFSKFPEYKKRIKRPEDIEIIPLLTDKVVVLSKENCPFCSRLKTKLEDYSNYTIINLNPDRSFSYNSDFTSLPIEERNSINNTTEKFIKDSSSNNVGLYFPTVFHGSDVTIGLPSDVDLNKIFKKNN